MPIFEYLCEDCGTKFEKLMRNGAASSLECPSCGQDHLKQEYSTFAARGGSPQGSAELPSSCPSGMCQTPGLCGRN